MQNISKLKQKKIKHQMLLFPFFCITKQIKTNQINENDQRMYAWMLFISIFIIKKVFVFIFLQYRNRYTSIC